jgi:hypothetical protein
MQTMIETISELKLESLNNLVSIRESKKDQIESYFFDLFFCPSGNIIFTEKRESDLYRFFAL